MDDGPRLTVKNNATELFFFVQHDTFFWSTSTCLLSLSMLVRGFEIVGYGLGVGLLGHLN